ncbi:MAG: LacI family DNA-binding transcriptional regulator [Acidimicrobiia bacterium]
MKRGAVPHEEQRPEARTLEELADLAGVSRSTVSRVFTGGSVRDETRDRVLEVARRTRYRPNRAARTLASGRSGVVGIVMHEEPSVLFQDPYFAVLLHGLTDALSEHAAGMMMWFGNRSKEQTLDQILGVGLIDGVVVTATNLVDPLVDGLLASDLPTVLIGHRRNDLSASYVDIDNVTAAYSLTRHLISLGRRRIGHITGIRGTAAGEDRLEGYRRAIARSGLESDEFIFEGDFGGGGGYAGAKTLAERDVDAIFCANDATAAGALDALRELDRRVPEDVALAGFDDLDFAMHMDPPLTTVRQGIHQQGVEAARALCQLIEEPDRGPVRILLPAELVIRQSSIGDVAAQ